MAKTPLPLMDIPQCGKDTATLLVALPWAEAIADSSLCATNTAKLLELGRGLSRGERGAPISQASTELGAIES